MRRVLILAITASVSGCSRPGVLTGSSGSATPSSPAGSSTSSSTSSGADSEAADSSIDAPTWVNGSYLTFAWRTASLGKVVAIVEALSTSSAAVPPGVSLVCATVDATGAGVPSTIEAESATRLAVTLATKLVETTALNCTIASGTGDEPELSKQESKQFAEVVPRRMSIFDYIRCLSTTRRHPSAECQSKVDPEDGS